MSVQRESCPVLFYPVGCCGCTSDPVPCDVACVCRPDVPGMQLVSGVGGL